MHTRKLLVLLLAVSMTLCIGCGKSGSSTQINYFTKDSMTIKKSAEQTSMMTEEKEKDSTQENTEEQNVIDDKRAENQQNKFVGELVLENVDSSVDYELDGSNVVYNGITFVDLQAVIDSVDTKYDKNTLLNFIIKTIDAKSDTMYCEIEYDSSEGEDSDVDDGSIVDEIRDNPNYINVQSKYNVDANWLITITDSSTMKSFRLYGCNSYLVIIGNNGDLTIDMSKLSTNSQDSEAVETTEDTPESETEGETDEAESTESEDTETD